jgi:hypothetical protein
VKVDLPVTYSVDGGPGRAGRVENISGSGILLISDTAVSAGTRLAITIADQRRGTAHNVAGDVVRSVGAGRVGVAFVHLDDAAIAFIRELTAGAR